MYSNKYSKKFKKLLRSPFPVMLQTFVLDEHSKSTWGTWGALEGHSKVTWALEGHSQERSKDTWALEAFGNSKDNWTLGHLRHLSTWALTYSNSTWGLALSGTRGTWGTSFSRFDLWFLSCMKKFWNSMISAWQFAKNWPSEYLIFSYLLTYLFLLLSLEISIKRTRVNSE